MKTRAFQILTLLDLSATSGAVLPIARDLARRKRARLLFLHALGNPENQNLGALPAEISVDRRDREQALTGLIEQFLGPGLDWETAVVTGDPVEEAVRLVRERQVDLVIAASFGLSGLKRLLVGKVVENLARLLPCPLLITPPPKRARRRGPSRDGPFFQRLAVGLGDPSREAALLESALSLPGETLQEIFLLHCLETPPDFDGAPRTQLSYSRYQQQTLDKIAADLGQAPRPGFFGAAKATPVLLTGPPGEAILDFAATHELDLIAVGVKDRSRFEKMFLGSTTETVIRGATCPVLVGPVEARGRAGP
ncbi:MAG: universal stress protein [Pseudomonadota bacterium]